MPAARHTVVFGLGITGDSCVRFLHGIDRLTVVDTRESPPFAAATRQRFPDVELVLGSVRPEQLANADRIIVSPGVPTSHCLLRVARDRGVPLVSDIELFLEQAKAPVIGITGTNGKSTVTALTGELLRAAGFDVGVGGNIGVPALDLLADSRRAYVLEVSSFQLERLNAGRFQIAANLNVTADHFDRYPDLASYAASKQRIFLASDVAVFNRADPLTVPSSRVDRRVSVGLDAPRENGWGIVVRDGRRYLANANAEVMAADELGIHGRHNEFNALVSLALAEATGAESRKCVPALRSFKGLEHRCQTVGVVANVTYINDSKATNVGACLAALDGLGSDRRNIVLIAGGDAKNADVAPLRDPIERFVRHVITMGKDAPAIEAAVAGVVSVHRVGTMREAVAHARVVARDGDLVLLSPACASLDMFKNFEDRGRQFAAAVAELRT